MRSGLIVTSLLVPLLACGGEGGSRVGEAGAAAAGDTPAVDACAVLAEVDAQAILGGPTESPVAVLQATNGPLSVSQCVIAASESAASLSLMLRHSATEVVPTTREEFLGNERAADVMGMGEEVAQALAAAEDVPGLGSLALFYEMLGHNLAVFWDQHYEMIVSVNIEDRAAALDHARVIAERVLARY